LTTLKDDYRNEARMQFSNQTETIMKKFILITSVVLTSNSIQAETYTQSKKAIRNILVSCLKDPENSRYSAAFNSCLLDASDSFIKKADLEFNKQLKTANAIERNSLIKDQRIYKTSLKNCEIYQNLSFDGFTKEAVCKIQTGKDYLSLLTGGASSLPSNWTLEDRVDKLFIGY
jgi:hypothetical protein